MSHVLEARDVGMSYPPPTSVTALADVAVTVDQGETLAVTGPSGSGKSTLLNLFGTLERPTTGSVHISGTDTSQLSAGEVAAVRTWQIGFVFQQFHLLEHLNVLDNVATGLLYRGLSQRVRRIAAEHALDRVGLAQRMQHKPSQLSGGERQRVAIARAVVGSPAIILADEPTGNLDSATGRHIVELLVALTTDGTTLLVVTHDATVARAMKREVCLRDGRIESDTAGR